MNQATGQMIPRQGRKTLASEAKHQVIIQVRSLAHDGEGGFVETYTSQSTTATPPVVIKRWAAVCPLQAWQLTNYKSVNVEASHMIKIRGSVTINESDRILFGAREFEVLTVEDIQERGVMKVCLCKERRYDG